MALRHMRFGAALVVGGIAALGAAACGSARDGGTASASGAGTASAASAIDAGPAVADVALHPLGTASVEEADYRHGAGAPAYAKALVAEKQGDWAAVVAQCKAARTADAHHIDAAWLEAAALARQNAFADVLEPLGVAAAGDWGKWGERSLVAPLLKDFLASPYGAAWQRAAAKYRDAYTAALARAFPVIARRMPALGDRPQNGDPGPADLFAYDPGEKRWLRLTRTGGEVVALVDALGAPFTAYVSFRDVRGAKGVERRFRVGAVDRATGRGGRELELAPGDAATVSVAWRSSRGGSEPGLEIETAPAKGGGPTTDWKVDWRRGTKVKEKGPIPLRGAVVTARGARRRRVPLGDVTADWDDDGAASAFRVDTSNQTVEPPGAPLVDGNTMQWSPDRARLAFATAPAEPCKTAHAAQIFVVDAATGVLRNLGDANDPGQLRWLDAGHLAYVTGGAIRVVDVARGDETATITGGGGVALDGWLVRRGCDRGDSAAVFAVDPNEPAEPSIDPGSTDPGASGDPIPGATPDPGSPTARDAGVSDAPAPSDAAR
jgi:hypothetical protein